MRTVDPATWSDAGLNSSREAHLRASLRDAARDWWRHSSVGTRTRLADTSLSTVERCVRGVFLLACVVWVVCEAGARWSRPAPAHEVSRAAPAVPINRVPFPAVALCSNNLISRGPLDNYTNYLHSLANGSHSRSSIRAGLLQLGALLTQEQPRPNVAFESLLARLDSINVTRIMAAFSPACDVIIKRCNWRGKAVACDKLFAARATPLGFCCIFNSRYYAIDESREPKYLDMVGQENGLAVVVQEDPGQFAHFRRATLGLDVLLFDGNEYPIVEGGGVRVYPVQQNTSIMLRLSARTQQPTDAVASCRSQGRGHSWCLTECRRRTVAALCSCQLYTLPPHPGTTGLRTCSYLDLPCLSKHREKLIYYYPETAAGAPELSEEAQNGQACEECVPDCARRLYTAAVSAARYHHHNARKLFRRPIADGTSLVNATVIRVFYSSRHQEQYYMDISQIWYETFASLGSMWRGITATTVVTVAELAFYLCVRWPHHYRRRTRERDI